MSYWLEKAGFLKEECCDVPTDVVDVVIIGCGISGASTAYHIANTNPTLKTIVLERGEISSGATGCNGGFICPGLSENFNVSVERYGLQVTQELFNYTVKCTDLVKDFIKKYNIDCELRFHGYVALARTEAEVNALSVSYEQLQSIGVSVELWDQFKCKEMTGSDSFHGGLYKPYGGLLWAARLVHGIILQAQKLGVDVYTHTEVEKIIYDGSIKIIHTNKGVIKTNNIVYCTNAWSRDLLPELQNIIIPVRNQLVMTEPLQPLWGYSMSINQGNEYVMQRPDGRVLIGGMRNIVPGLEVNSADTCTLNADVSTAMRCYLRTYFPHAMPQYCVLKREEVDIENEEENHTTGGDTIENNVQSGITEMPPTTPSTIHIENEWIGIMGFTPDRNPLVGALPSRPGEYIAAGYTGHGMPVAFLAGANIASLITKDYATAIKSSSNSCSSSDNTTNSTSSADAIPAAYLPDRFDVW